MFLRTSHLNSEEEFDVPERCHREKFVQFLDDVLVSPFDLTHYDENIDVDSNICQLTSAPSDVETIVVLR